ncbi:MAG: sigma-70 family RNA polymerase sigma factor [Planctomycetota bacterium]
MLDNTAKQEWQKIAQGCPDAWRNLLDEQIPILYAMFMKRRPNFSLAEELTQKTIFDAVKAKAGYDPSRGSPQQWLFGIAKNNLALEARKRAAAPKLDGDITTYLHAIDKQPLPDEILERKETAVMVRAALNRLDAADQAVLRAKYLDDLSARDIAGKMGKTEKAVHSLLYRARSALKRQLLNIEPPQIRGNENETQK